MPSPPSWRDLLKDIISDAVVRDRLASAVGVHPMTLTRWAHGESSPRPANLRQLLAALPHEQRTRLAALLKDEQVEFSDVSLSESQDQIESAFVMQVLELRETTSEVMLFWALCNKVFQHALRRLDPERIGVAIRVVLCMPPTSSGKIHSLRESVGRGTPPWSDDLEQEAIFLGAESLAGYVVASLRSETIQDLSRETYRLPARRAEHELSATAVPLLYGNRVAGCVLVSSTQPGYFVSSSRLSLIADFTRLISLAFKPEQFYPPEWIDLRVMPSFDMQQGPLVSFRDRIIALMQETSGEKLPLSRTQAEQRVWQQLEEELIYSRQS